MRLTLEPRVRRAVALCGLACLVPATAVAAARPTAPTSAAPVAAQSVTARLADSTVRWGQHVRVAGRVAGGSNIQPVALQYRVLHGVRWRTIAHTRTSHHRYAFTARVPGRGAVRVVLGDGRVAAPRAGAAAAGAPATVASRIRGVQVRAVLRFARRSMDVTSGRRASVAGRVLPREGGRLVVLQQRNGHHWTRVARAKTDAHGAYRVAYRPRHTALVRVVTGTNAAATGTARSAGHVHVLRPALASRYDDYGSALACGGSLGYGTLGVANKSLPCGTKVTISYHGNTVTVPVIDRGPYVGGREFDLSGATARALGFDGVGTIYVSR